MAKYKQTIGMSYILHPKNVNCEPGKCYLPSRSVAQPAELFGLPFQECSVRDGGAHLRHEREVGVYVVEGQQVDAENLAYVE